MIFLGGVVGEFVVPFFCSDAFDRSAEAAGSALKHEKQFPIDSSRA